MKAIKKYILLFLLIQICLQIDSCKFNKYYAIFFQTSEQITNKNKNKQKDKIELEEKLQENIPPKKIKQEVEKKQLFVRHYKETYKLAYNLIDNYIHQHIFELTKKPSNKEERMIKAGKFPDYFPEAQIKAAKERQEELKKLNILPINPKYLYDTYRFCIFPIHTPNGYEICQNQDTLLQNKEKEDFIIQCKQLMCLNCCNFLLFEMKHIIDNSIVSIPFKLNDDQGFNKIKQIQKQTNTVQKCRKSCMDEYPFDIPEPPIELIRLEVLGIKKEYPADSCEDLKRYGREDLPSGLYFIQKGKMYCDMDIDGGGWSLFFNYRHRPFELTEISLQSEAVPQDQYTDKMHLNLNSLQLDQSQIKELRFFCMTSNMNKKKERFFVHFKTRNTQVIQTAVDGNQQNMDEKSFQSEMGQLESPEKMKGLQEEMKIGESEKFVRSDISKKAMIVNTKNDKGGLWDTPFSNADARWTVKGPKSNVVVYECGDLIEDPVRDGANYDTLHQIWFRKNEPNRKVLENRQKKILKEINQSDKQQ